jgi:ABC-type phosphate/phosphonate transport system substrate-binding protein
MNKRIGWIALAVAGVLVVGSCYGFLSVKTDKAPVADKKGSGMTFPDMMNQLSRNMSLWERLSAGEKKQAVDAVIVLYKNEDNVAILNAGEFYVGKIDETVRANPQAANMDIMALLRILAVMEYDFFNGENKDAMAKRLLGEKGFQENQMRRQMAARFSGQQKR